jgi:hypothetical protein
VPGIATGFHRRSSPRSYRALYAGPRLGSWRWNSEATESLCGGIAERPAERPRPAIAGIYCRFLYTRMWARCQPALPFPRTSLWNLAVARVTGEPQWRPAPRREPRRTGGISLISVGWVAYLDLTYRDHESLWVRLFGVTQCKQAAQGAAIWASCSMTLFSPRNTAPPTETVSWMSRQRPSRSVRTLSSHSGLATTSGS